MKKQEFWSIIGTAKSSDREDQLAAIAKTLRALEVPEIVSFNNILWAYVDELCHHDVWGGFYQIHGGCSDDGFVYCRLGLILRGQKIVKAIIRNADELAKVDDPAECEELMHTAPTVYGEKSGEAIPMPQSVQTEVQGEYWDFEDDDEVKQRLPKLWKKLNASDDPDQAEVLYKKCKLFLNSEYYTHINDELTSRSHRTLDKSRRNTKNMKVIYRSYLDVYESRSPKKRAAIDAIIREALGVGFKE
jgi:hypothetical protein